MNRILSFRPLAYLKIIEAIVNTVVSMAIVFYMVVWSSVLGALGGGFTMVGLFDMLALDAEIDTL